MFLWIRFGVECLLAMGALERSQIQMDTVYVSVHHISRAEYLHTEGADKLIPPNFGDEFPALCEAFIERRQWERCFMFLYGRASAKFGLWAKFQQYFQRLKKSFVKRDLLSGHPVRIYCVALSGPSKG
jgi:hypothetical protein